jgi:hypothetical protein
MNGNETVKAWNALPYDHTTGTPVCPTAEDMGRAISPVLFERDALLEQLKTLRAVADRFLHRETGRSTVEEEIHNAAALIAKVEGIS